MPPPQTTHTHDTAVAGLTEPTLRHGGILPRCWCVFLASIESIGYRKANAHVKMASRQAGHCGEVGAYLDTVDLEGQKQQEGGVCTRSDSLFPSQDSS